MKTSSFSDYKDGPGRISIARWAPRGFPEGYRVFKALAPGKWFKDVDKAEYLLRFNREMLEGRDPRALWDALHALVAPEEPILLCWEKHPLTEKNWCHRTIVADYFRRELGYDVPELVAPPKAKAPRPRAARAPRSDAPRLLTLPFDEGTRAAPSPRPTRKGDR